MKKFSRLLFATVISISISSQFDDGLSGNVAYASNGISLGNIDNIPAVSIKGNSEKFKAEFAYEMAQITAKIVSAANTNAENFKVEFAYATALVTTKVMSILPNDQRNAFSYEMAQITAKIVSDPNLDIERAKAEFTYEIAQLTTRIITNADKVATGNNTVFQANKDYFNSKTTSKTSHMEALLRNNADIEITAASTVNRTGADQNAAVNSVYIAPETYTGLVDELSRIGKTKPKKKVNVDGEIRYHYALNSGSTQWSRDSAGFRAYLGADTEINKDWRAYGMLEGHANVINYKDQFKLSRLYVTGKLSTTSLLRAGSFGYLMAEGNIYDSGFKGIQADFGNALKYTVSLGKTDSTAETQIVTARYADYDYNLEAGVYHYQTDDEVSNQNTIRTFGGNYRFSNFGVGAMALNSSLKDSNGNGNGYVFSVNYGDFVTYRPYTYSIFAKYYNQPRYTYIAHGMNGSGGQMQGFKGYGLGVNYTLSENFVAGIEYYELTDKISREKGRTWWSQLTRYF